MSLDSRGHLRRLPVQLSDRLPDREPRRAEGRRTVRLTPSGHRLILKLGDPDSCRPRPTETAIAETSGGPTGYGSLALTRSMRA